MTRKAKNKAFIAEEDICVGRLYRELRSAGISSFIESTDSVRCLVVRYNSTTLNKEILFIMAINLETKMLLVSGSKNIRNATPKGLKLDYTQYLNERTLASIYVSEEDKNRLQAVYRIPTDGGISTGQFFAVVEAFADDLVTMEKKDSYNMLK